MSNLPDIETLVVHLTLLGFKPSMFSAGRGKFLSISNERQTFWVQYGRVYYTVRVAPLSAMKEVPWWKFADADLRKLAMHVDNNLIGGWDGETD